MATVTKVKALFSRDDIIHTRGYHVVASALRDGGIEVILGGSQLPREIASSAVDEDVDLICYRIESGVPTILVETLMEELRRAGSSDIPVIVGGIIPHDQFDELREMGIKGIFVPGSPLDDIVKCALECSKNK